MNFKAAFSFSTFITALVCAPLHAVAQTQPLTLCGEGTGGLPSAWTRDGSDLFTSGGNVGVNESDPSHTLDVGGTVNADQYLLDGTPLDDLYVNEAEADSRFVNEGQANAIDSSMIVDGAIGGTDVDKEEVQLRVGAHCPVGEAIRLIGHNGGVKCQPVPSLNSTWTSPTYHFAFNDPNSTQTYNLGTVDEFALCAISTLGHDGSNHGQCNVFRDTEMWRIKLQKNLNAGIYCAAICLRK